MEKFTLTNKKNNKSTHAFISGVNEKFLLKSKRSQAWSLDLIIAGFIFLVAIMTLYLYAINYSSQSQENLNELYSEGQVASELILSENDFGILSDKRVNQTKLDEYNYTSNYSGKRDVLGVTHDFYFSIDGSNFGRLNSTQISDLIQITRITIYQDKPTKFEIYIYDEE